MKALKLTDGSVRQIAVMDEGVRHGLLKPASGGGFIFGHAQSGEVYIYRANAKQKIVAGIVVRPNSAPAAIPIDAARSGLNGELAWWGKVAGKIAPAPP